VVEDRKSKAIFAKLKYQLKWHYFCNGTFLNVLTSIAILLID